MDLEAVKQLSNQSNYYNLLGMRVIDIKPGYARMELDVTDPVRQTYGHMHGGAIASIVDEAGGLAVFGAQDDPVKTVTIEMKVNYIAPLANGTLVTEGRVMHMGRRTAVSQVEARGDDGRLIALGLCTYMLIESSPMSHIMCVDEGAEEL